MLLILCAIIMLFAVTACSPAEKEQTSAIVGRWEYESSDSMYYQFNEDGTGTYYFIGSAMKFTYEDGGYTVSIQFENDTYPTTLKYTIDGNKLNIEDSFGDMVTYIKK